MRYTYSAPTDETRTVNCREHVISDTMKGSVQTITVRKKVVHQVLLSCGHWHNKTGAEKNTKGHWMCTRCSFGEDN